MKIILLKSHDNLGNVGEIINVKSGFARNYLIPNKIGSPATEQNIKSLGNHKIEINLGYELETKIKIKVSATSE